jgi:Family of unknown function (DUF5670)
MLALGVILLVLWIVAFVAVEVTSVLIHLLLLAAVIAFVRHVMQRRARPLE